MEAASGSEEKAVWVMAGTLNRRTGEQQKTARDGRARRGSVSGSSPHGQAGEIEAFVALPHGQAGGIGGGEQFELLLRGAAGSGALAGLPFQACAVCRAAAAVV